jgi:hypothetical protein
VITLMGRKPQACRHRGVMVVVGRLQRPERLRRTGRKSNKRTIAVQHHDLSSRIFAARAHVMAGLDAEQSLPGGSAIGGSRPIAALVTASCRGPAYFLAVDASHALAESSKTSDAAVANGVK